jgi:hypothetical protein
LMPGARSNESHVFTRVRECRNQQLVQARQADAAGMTLKPYSAKDTLIFFGHTDTLILAVFSVRKYKPTALILEYLVSRAAKQGVAAPPFATAKPNSGKTKLRTANALRSDFKEAGNDSSTIWSMICGMMI